MNADTKQLIGVLYGWTAALLIVTMIVVLVGVLAWRDINDEQELATAAEANADAIEEIKAALEEMTETETREY